MEGFAFSNSATWALNWLTAAWVLPGISDATLIVTVLDAPADTRVAALVAAVTHRATRHPAVTAAVMAFRVDFIVAPCSSMQNRSLRWSGGARRSCPGAPHLLRAHRSRVGRGIRREVRPEPRRS